MNEMQTAQKAYESLTPEKKIIFMTIMQTFANMMVMLAATSTSEQKKEEKSAWKRECHANLFAEVTGRAETGN